MVKGYQHAAAYDDGDIKVSDIHTLRYEQYGKTDGKPVIFLHGGPGGGTSPENTAFFNPDVYRVVLLDQRGAGKSRPTAETRDNTSQLLVADIETVRKYLGISKWHMVFGGSWGSTLALLYSQTHPEAVGSLVLRGIFLGRKSELDWNYLPNAGHAMFYPEAYESLVNHLPGEERVDLPVAYYKRLMSSDPEARTAAARSWNSYEIHASKVDPVPEDLMKLDDDNYNLAHATLECHYFINGIFLEEGQLLKKKNIDKMRHIPGSIVQGRLDLVCPPRSAWDLHKAWPESKLYMMPASGHNAREPRIFDKLVQLCDEYARLD